MAFNVGDQVQLNSGGPRMTISHTNRNGSVDTRWHNSAGDLRFGCLEAGTFIAAAPLPPPVAAKLVKKA